MSADFDEAVRVVLRHEGGYVDDPDDPGGATHHGISLRFARGTMGCEWTAEDIKSLSPAQAMSIYRRYWWDRYGYGQIEDQLVATKVLDLAVNVGPAQAHKLVQRALNACGYALDDDGILGVKSVAAINAAPREALLNKIVGQQSDFYRKLAVSKPPLAKFLKGWLHRAAWPLGSQSQEA